MEKSKLEGQHVGREGPFVTVRLGPFLMLLMVFIGVGLYSWFVWPTPYFIALDDGLVIRVERTTGVRERATGTGWKTQEQVEAENEQKKVEK